MNMKIHVVSEIYELKIHKKKVIVYDALGNNITESPSVMSALACRTFYVSSYCRFICLNIRL